LFKTQGTVADIYKHMLVLVLLAVNGDIRISKTPN